MKLLEFISDRERRLRLASKVSRNPVYLWQVATGRRKASPGLAIAIEAHTSSFGVGTVFKQDLRPDIWPELVKSKKKNRAA